MVETSFRQQCEPIHLGNGGTNLNRQKLDLVCQKDSKAIRAIRGISKP